jgi:hypothetical protein
VACHVTVLRDLDTRRRPILNLPVRAAAVAVFVVLASSTAWARPRVQVAPFSVHGETLGYFGPEVARAVTAALEGDGVETGPGAADTINGRVEELSGERVRLSATLRGRTIVAEGPLEAIDAVATQLANRMAPLLIENDPAAQKLAEKRARDAEKRAAAVPPSRPAPATKTPSQVEARAGERVRAGEAKREPQPAVAASSAAADENRSDDKPTEESKPEPKLGANGEAKPAANGDAKPAANGEAKPAANGEAKPAATVEAKPGANAPAASVVGKPEPSRSAEWTPPRVDGPPMRAAAPPPPPAYPVAPPSPSPYFGGFVRGRVVAHAVADARPSYPSAGVMATQALFSFLQRRLRLSVIPTGVGITSAGVAADEAYRAAARAVVMARLESVELLPGPTARVRLEVVVVRDGRPVMRRIVESAPSDPNRRRSTADPVYQAVTVALEALVPELVGALADVR